MQSCVQQITTNDNKLSDEENTMGTVQVSTTHSSKTYKIYADDFHGAYVVSGAQNTVIGKRQAPAYKAEFVIDIRPRIFSQPFCFGERQYRGIVFPGDRTTVLQYHFIEVGAEVVDVSVSLLIRLNAFSNMRAILYFKTDRILSRGTDGPSL